MSVTFNTNTKTLDCSEAINTAFKQRHPRTSFGKERIAKYFFDNFNVSHYKSYNQQLFPADKTIIIIVHAVQKFFNIIFQLVNVKYRFSWVHTRSSTCKLTVELGNMFKQIYDFKEQGLKQDIPRSSADAILKGVNSTTQKIEPVLIGRFENKDGIATTLSHYSYVQDTDIVAALFSQTHLNLLCVPLTTHIFNQGEVGELLLVQDSEKQSSVTIDITKENQLKCEHKRHFKILRQDIVGSIVGEELPIKLTLVFDIDSQTGEGTTNLVIERESQGLSFA
jgi:hypothetical protein